MGLVYANIELVNFADETLCEDGYLPAGKIRKTAVQTLADSGAIWLVINETVRKQLGSRIRDRIAVTLADGTKREVDYAGPVKIIFRKRFCITDALVVPEGEEVLLGGPVFSMRKVA